jgi:hypothetical protein
MLSVEDIPELFQDLAPIPQNDGPDRVCVIEYPSAFTLAYNYMRAVWAAKELSGTCTHVRSLFLCNYRFLRLASTRENRIGRRSFATSNDGLVFLCL